MPWSNAGATDLARCQRCSSYQRDFIPDPNEDPTKVNSLADSTGTGRGSKVTRRL